jgi:hypothetical protein
MSMAFAFNDQGVEGSELRRRCAKRRCPEPAQLGGSHRGALCLLHHAARMRLWRARRRAAGKPIAGASKTAPSSSTEATRARKALSRARQTGAVIAEPCRACRSVSGVIATHPDPDEPTKTVWACRACRSQLVAGTIERKRDAAAEVERQRAHTAFAEMCGNIDGIVASLPTEIAAALHDTATRSGPFGHNRPGQPIYTQMLVRAYLSWAKNAASHPLIRS